MSKIDNEVKKRNYDFQVRKWKRWAKRQRITEDQIILFMCYKIKTKWYPGKINNDNVIRYYKEYDKDGNIVK